MFLMILFPGRWECPWHQCDVCGKEASSFCEMCPNSYCNAHREGMLFISKLDGKLSCNDHDPCGPDPLEPGEIRESMPNMASMRPGNMAVPVPPVLPVIKGATPPPSSSSSAAHLSSPPTQAAPSCPEPPPRLYINTKTATSRLIPSGRSYPTDRTEQKTSTTSGSPSGEGEAVETEEEEVYSLDMEDDDDDDEEENETEDLEILEDEDDDEEEEGLYGSDVIEEDEEEGGDEYETWGDYDADDGEVGEWGRMEDEK